MKNSFKIFSVLVGLLVVFIILRLNSISYPRDTEDNTEVIYLESFSGYGSLFDIRYDGSGYHLNPETGDIRVSGVEIDGKTEIHDNDLIMVEDRRFLFSILPRSTSYREVFRRPMQEAFAGSPEKYIGGWLSSNRKELLAENQTENRITLRRMMIEITADELKNITAKLDSNQLYNGRLFTLLPVRETDENRPERNEDDSKTDTKIDTKIDTETDTDNTAVPNRSIRLISNYIPVILVRKWKEVKKNPNEPFIIRNGDILKLPYQNGKFNNQSNIKSNNKSNSKSTDALFIKFNIFEYRGTPFLSISYRDHTPREGGSKTGREIAFLKSLDTGITYGINRGKTNAFIGSKGLFTFTLSPSLLASKLYVPDRIPEGGIVDIKELLDNRMYYLKDNRYYPVTRDFLAQLKQDLDGKKPAEVQRYLEKHKIRWREVDGYRRLKRFSAGAEALIRKMENKGSYRRFCVEIEKLNHKHHLFGLGIDAGEDNRAIEGISYKPADQAWLNAMEIKDDTPIIQGIEQFYWGSRIKDGDQPVLFKIRFKNPPESIRIIAPGEYGFGFDGKKFTNCHFRDGVQTVAIPGGKRELLVKLKNNGRFNRKIASTNFQGQMTLTFPDGTRERLETDEEWDVSINGHNWSDAVVNPPFSLPEPSAGDLKSIWYNETWNPVYRGIKFRYFRKTFPLDELPQSVKWKFHASGEYLLKVNRKPVQSGEEFLKALRKGNNVVIVTVTRPGYRKRYSVSRMFRVKDQRVILMQKQVHRTSFRKGTTGHKPQVLDTAGHVLAYSSNINGRSKRFYEPRAQKELLSFFGSPRNGIWGLEQIFSQLYKEGKIHNIQLTVNSEWQTIALEAMKKILHRNREKEINHPQYKKLIKDLQEEEKKLQQSRDLLAAASEADQNRLMTTVIRLQETVDEIRADIDKIKNHFYEAAVILMSPGGEILTAASYPYDEETMTALNPQVTKPYRPRENPYLNRNWKWKYNPGSTVKILDAVAFLQARELRDETGGYRFPYLRRLLSNGDAFRNFPRSDIKNSVMLNGKEILFRLRNFRGHTMAKGYCSLRNAFAHSYNTYFSYLALHANRMLTHDSRVYELGENESNRVRFISRGNIPVTRTYWEFPLLEAAEKIRVNRNIDLLYNLEGTDFSSELVRMPTDSFLAVESHFPVNNYTAADVAHYSIGQGDFQLTALQNAMMASTILNRGTLYNPSVIRAITLMGDEPGRPGKQVRLDPSEGKEKVFEASIADEVKQAMKAVVNAGTAVGLFKKLKQGRQFYAKTGTAETELYKDNSFFVGFVRFRNGESLVYSVIVPRSGEGAKVAGKLTEAIIEAIVAHEATKGRKI
jgi:cell division protein FtsI/penicillin-binding protein 2